MTVADGGEDLWEYVEVFCEVETATVLVLISPGSNFHDACGTPPSSKCMYGNASDPKRFNIATKRLSIGNDCLTASVQRKMAECLMTCNDWTTVRLLFFILVRLAILGNIIIVGAKHHICGAIDTYSIFGAAYLKLKSTIE